jgi:hypothetical protein
MLWQSVDLLDVKDRIAFHERNGPFGILAGCRVGLGTNDLVGIDHKAAAFTPADIGFQLDGLLEGHPDRRGIAFLDGC